MATRETSRDEIKKYLTEKSRRIHDLYDEISRLEEKRDEIEGLLPFTSCDECGAEAVPTGENFLFDGAKDARMFASWLGKKSMVCPWCDGKAVALYAVKQYNIELSNGYADWERHADVETKRIRALLHGECLGD